MGTHVSLTKGISGLEVRPGHDYYRTASSVPEMATVLPALMNNITKLSNYLCLGYNNIEYGQLPTWGKRY